MCSSEGVAKLVISGGGSYERCEFAIIVKEKIITYKIALPCQVLAQ